MAITNFIPEVWAAQLLAILDKNLVYAGSPCVNRDYEGEIAAYGDTVHIASISDVSIVDYTKDTDLTVETLTDADRTLLIDQAKAFAFEIDDIDLRQARSGGALMSEAARRAAFGLRDKADQFVHAKMIGGAGSALGVVDATTASNVYDTLIVPAKVELDEVNVPTEGRWLVIDPATHGKLLLDSRFVKVNESGTSEGLRNGIVGSAGGFTIMLSNNASQRNRTAITATTTSGNKTITAAAGTFSQADVGLSIAGTGVGASSNKVASVNADGSSIEVTTNSSASATVADVALSGGGRAAVAGSALGTSYAEQIAKVEAFRPEKRFADALKGLHLYGSKVVRPEALVVASVKVA
ncbi:coat protein [Nocardioides marmoriginsengisoli]|uniref:Coat protein n=1 Tax=Nocardioides marmoriginsengisoli TaxID=661483 RepID=A0A3N0CL44_9ACTN|nr:P22 phage major capsid protein family protein [Nocardioides marmoriginsengisoli]RNL63643.1 coat protein [Nocardioides marmoriginsengisoli]